MATSFILHASLILVCSQLAVSFPFPPPVFDKITSEPESPPSTSESQSSSLPPTEAPFSSTTNFPTPPSPSPQPSQIPEEVPAKKDDSFHLSMQNNIVLSPNSQTQLKMFKLPSDMKGTGGLEPGQYLGSVKDLDPINGVFTAKGAGFFFVTASVQLRKTTPAAAESEATMQEVSVAVCINPTSDRCNEALYTTGVLRGSQTTLAVFGNVHLARDQRVIVRITSKSGSDVIVLSHSSFSVHRL